MEVRTVERNGEPWWVLKDVCEVLGISHITDTASRLDLDEVGQTEVIDKLGRAQNTYIINESGLYNVILRSDISIRGEAPDGYFKQITLTFNPWSDINWLKALS